MVVVPALDVGEDRHPSGAAGQENGAVEQLAVERRPEALGEGVVVGVASTVFAVFIVLLVTHMRSRGILATLAYLSAGGIMATNWVSASLVYAMVDAAHRTGSDAGVVALFSTGKTMAEADGGFVAIAIVAMSILGLRSRSFPGPICWLGIVAGGYHFVEVPIQLAVTGTATGRTGPIGVVIGELWVLLVGVTLVIQSIRRPQPSPDKQQAPADVAGETVSART